MKYKCTCVGEKEITAKNEKKYTLLWIVFYNDDDEFVDCIKLFKNKSLNDIKLGVMFRANKGFNKKSRESFLYNIELISTDTTA